MPAKLMLDVHLSTALADALRRHGVDTVAASEDPSLLASEDEEVLREAARQGRALVTYNVQDFVALARRWALEERRHAGVLLLHARSIPQGDVGSQLRALLRLVHGQDLTGDEPFRDLVLFVAPPSP